jgi:cytochrome c oxidase assembly protein subunit 15
MNDKQVRHFVLAAWVTIIAVYILIVVGSSVRATGAGMGCPDWPTCFGQVIPPTSEAQLPPNYQEIYRDRGYAELRFNAVKTWTEFFNRLTGVTIGFLAMWTLWAGWRIRQTHKTSFYFALTAFLLIGFNGWLGKVVVSSNLHPVIITTHMVASLLVVASLILALVKAQTPLQLVNQRSLVRRLQAWLLIGLTLTLIQIGLGVQVREQIDVIALGTDYHDRALWVAQVGQPVFIHVLFALVIVVYNWWLAKQLVQSQLSQTVVRLGRGLMLLVLTELSVGVLLGAANFPAFLQPVHLVLAGLVFGTQFYLMSVLLSVQHRLSEQR